MSVGWVLVRILLCCQIHYSQYVSQNLLPQGQRFVCSLERCSQPRLSMLELCSDPRSSKLDLCSQPRPSKLELCSEPRSSIQPPWSQDERSLSPPRSPALPSHKTKLRQGWLLAKKAYRQNLRDPIFLVYIIKIVRNSSRSTSACCLHTIVC
jgi:hypothetical protein